MKGGIIGFVDGDTSPLTDEFFTREEGEHTLTSALEIRNTFDTADGTTVYHGRAGAEELVETEKVQMSEGHVAQTTGIEKAQKFTQFLAVPGEYVIVGSSKGTFAFDLIGRATSTIVNRANINLNRFIENHEGADFWKLGFYGTGGAAKKGTVYGNDVLQDNDLGEILSMSNKNQIGLDYSYNEDGVKVTLTESGYLEVYQPSSYDTEEFAEFFLDEVRSCVTLPDGN